jgi:cysteine synthase B
MAAISSSVIRPKTRRVREDPPGRSARARSSRYDPRMDLLDLIGNTPLIELRSLAPRPEIRLFAKLEGGNPSGSIKDRVALALVRAHEAAGRLRPGGTIVEASSGNTGIALATIARRRGFRAVVVLPQEVPAPIFDLLDLLGADIEMCAGCHGMDQAIARASRLAEQNGWPLLGQFDDPGNIAIHEQTTGAEIDAALPKVDLLVAGIGTGGTIMGVSRRLRARNPRLRVIGVEPRFGDHLQGLRRIDDGYRPPLLDLDALDGRVLIDSATALRTAREIAQAEGICAGVSSGAVVAAALRQAQRLECGNVVVMFSDGGWKYLPARPWDAAADADARLDDVHWW